MALENLQYMAKGCFIAGTRIATPNGERPIESLKPGDEVISFNEKTGRREVSKIGEVDVLKRESYYSINEVTGDEVFATGDHPFYTNRGVVKVQDLEKTDKLINFDGKERSIDSIGEVRADKDGVVVYNLLDVEPNNNYYANSYLVHNKGCFLEGTPIRTPYGIKYVEDFLPGDEVVSFNEETKQLETSKVERLDVLAARRYYNINYAINVTGEHPFYTKDGIKKVSELRQGDVLITREGEEVVSHIRAFDRDVVIYNLINVVPNHNYYAADYLVHNKGGGGCFLAGTQVTMQSGNKNIEDVKAGDKIWTLNEKTQITELATVGELQVLKESGYYIINGEVRTTAKHPFYTTDGLKTVEELKIGDLLYKGFDNKTSIKTIDYIGEDVTVYNLLNVTPNHNYLADGYLVHNKGGFGGGGRSSGGSHSSSSGSKSSGFSSGPKPGVSTAKPGSTIKTSDGKTVKSSTKTPTKQGFSTSKGIVGDNGYTPKFTNGYSAPAGSVVYYRDTSFVDYLPWVYLFMNSNAAPQNQQATIVQPDGKEVQAQPVQEGVDGLAVLNWILLIAIVAGIIGGIVWGVNKWSSRNDPPKRESYGW